MFCRSMGIKMFNFFMIFFFAFLIDSFTRFVFIHLKIKNKNGRECLFPIFIRILLEIFASEFSIWEMPQCLCWCCCCCWSLSYTFVDEYFFDAVFFFVPFQAWSLQDSQFQCCLSPWINTFHIWVFDVSKIMYFKVSTFEFS